MPNSRKPKKPQPKATLRPIESASSIRESLAQVEDDRWSEWQDGGAPTVRLGVRLTAATGDGGAAAQIAAPLADELTDLLWRHDPRLAVELFLGAQDQWDRQLERLATLRCMELLDGLSVPAIPFPGFALPEDETFLRDRTLNPVESANLRLVARSNDQRSGVLSLLEQTATSGEVGAISADHVDDADHQVCSVLLPGMKRAHGAVGIADRVASVEGSGAAAIRRLICAHRSRGDDASLHWAVRSTHVVGSPKMASAIGMILPSMFQEAGLKGDPTVNPMSIRNTAGRRIYEMEGLEAAAERMGMPRRYDSLRVQIGLQPWAPPRKRR